jgi:ABC-2 type transport system permease protein
MNSVVSWRGYGAIFSARFRMLLQYRAAAVAGFGTQLFWGLIRVMIFTAFYASSAHTQPMSLPETITYLWLVQAMFAMVPWSVDSEVRALIRSGTVAYEMLRPLDLYTLWYSRGIASRLAPTTLRAVPMFLVAIPFFGMGLPPSFGSGLGWLLTTFAALLLSSAVSTLVVISMLFTISGDGIARFVPPIIFALSGMLLPLPLMPRWAQGTLNFLPFRDLADVPFRVYMGHIPFHQLGPVLLHQVAWLIALILLGRALLARATHRMVVQGG